MRDDMTMSVILLVTVLSLWHCHWLSAQLDLTLRADMKLFACGFLAWVGGVVICNVGASRIMTLCGMPHLTRACEILSWFFFSGLIGWLWYANIRHHGKYQRDLVTQRKRWLRKECMWSPEEDGDHPDDDWWKT